MIAELLVEVPGAVLLGLVLGSAELVRRRPRVHRARSAVQLDDVLRLRPHGPWAPRPGR